MSDEATTKIENAKSFIFSSKTNAIISDLPAVSIFSGGGISDLGYEAVGFSFMVQAEKEDHRAKLCKSNFGNSTCVIGDIRQTAKTVISEYRQQKTESPALISITPPCQGVSSSNPSRGKIAEPKTSDERNTLVLDTIPVIKELAPRIVVIENVPQLLNRVVAHNGREEKVFSIFENELKDQYQFFTHIVQMADYGVPQDRRRLVIVAVSKKEDWLSQLTKNSLLPIPRNTHSREASTNTLPWITLKKWLADIGYETLDASSPEKSSSSVDVLHQVPSYDADRYTMISDIPRNSGNSAYQNKKCHNCGNEDVPLQCAYCPTCDVPMTNRPIVVDKTGVYRLIKGFASSYRRMYPDRPAATITTASSHIGSDYKIHPYENRVLSIRECADLQTVPRYYDFSWAMNTRHVYISRQVIGEALPPWFTYQHGLVLKNLLTGTFKQSEYFDFCFE